MSAVKTFHLTMSAMHSSFVAQWDWRDFLTGLEVIQVRQLFDILKKKPVLRTLHLQTMGEFSPKHCRPLENKCMICSALKLQLLFITLKTINFHFSFRSLPPLCPISSHPRHISSLPSCPHLSVYSFIFTRTYTARMTYCRQFPPDLYHSIFAVVVQSDSTPVTVRQIWI